MQQMWRWQDSNKKDLHGKLFRFTLIILMLPLTLSACAPRGDTIPASDLEFTAVPPTTTPDWFDIELTDVQTGAVFRMSDYAGKVVLVETMAIWCPNCTVQANEVRNLHEALGDPDDFISVSLDVDMNEDEASLKEYASSFGFGWHFAVAPLEVARALGTLYSAQYLNPPLAPMLIIDRDGSVHQLEYGIKDADTLQEAVEPYLGKK